MQLAEKIDNAAFIVDVAARAALEWLRAGVVYNPMRPAMRVDPYPSYHRLRERDPVHRSYPAAGWILTRYRDILAILGDRAYSSDERNWTRYPRMRRRNTTAGLPDPYEAKLVSMLRIDPPIHTRLRGLVSQAFTPRAVERMRPRVEAWVEALLGAVEGRGEMELIADFASPLPVSIIAEMLGVPPEDREQFRLWSDETIRALGDGTIDDRKRGYEGMRELRRYLTAEVERRRAEPREDLLSRLVAAEEGGQRLDTDELFATCVLLLVAGNETTTNLIANGLIGLLRHRDQLELLRSEPERVPQAIEEMLRWDSPVQLTSRIALQDGEIDGRPVRRGQQLVLVLGAGNRDPEQFADPDRLDVTRADVRPLSFGHGIHFCLGAQLARLEATIAFEALVSRLPNLRLGDEPIRWGDNTVLRGPRAVPLRWGA